MVLGEARRAVGGDCIGRSAAKQRLKRDRRGGIIREIIRSGDNN